MSPEAGTFISMDTYSGTLDNPVSLHKYLYANANPVMYTDPTGYFSIMETQLAQTIKSTIQSASVPAMNFHKIMSWANMAVTAYDIGCQLRLFISGDGNFFGLVVAIAKGMFVQSLLSCGLTVLLGKSATLVLKLVGIKQDAESFVEAVKGGDPVEIFFESMRLVVSLFTLKCQCFTGDTLVSTVDGDRRIDEICTGDYIWSYDTETGERVKAKVTNVSVTEADVLVHVFTDDGEEIKTTMFHPFYVKNVADDKDVSYNGGKWKAASNLSAGDELLTEDGKVVYVKEVRIERLEESIKVYNLEVEGLHTYYVGEGVLVHNMCAKNYGESIVLSEKKMYQLGYHYNKHGVHMGYSSKKEYEQAARDFLFKYASVAEIYEGTFNNSHGINVRKRQIIVRYNGKQLIISKELSQLIDFYEGTSLDSFIDVERVQ